MPFVIEGDCHDCCRESFASSANARLSASSVAQTPSLQVNAKNTLACWQPVISFRAMAIFNMEGRRGLFDRPDGPGTFCFSANDEREWMAADRENAFRAFRFAVHLQVDRVAFVQSHKTS